MSAASSAAELSRTVIDEQLSWLHRWNDAADRYVRDVERLATGEIDTIAFGREVSDLAATEAVRSVEVAARVGISYVEFLTSLAEPSPRRGREPSPRPDRERSVAAGTDAR